MNLQELIPLAFPLLGVLGGVVYFIFFRKRTEIIVAPTPKPSDVQVQEEAKVKEQVEALDKQKEVDTKELSEKHTVLVTSQTEELQKKTEEASKSPEETNDFLKDISKKLRE